MVRIVTDSTADLTNEIASALQITIVPLCVNFGDESYRDNIDLTTEEFYKKLANCTTLPTTSSPSPGNFAEVYDKLAGETDEILTITISSKLSASYQAAVDGAKLRKSKSRVEIIDSLSAVVGLGLIVISAAKAAQAGCSIDEVIGVTKSSMQRIELRIAFDTLEYLKRGGRIGTAQAFLGSMLKINPILTIKDGITEGVAKPRSRAKALDYLYDFAMSFSHIEEIAIEDANTPDDVENLMNRLSVGLPRERIYKMKVSPVIGTHVGPRVVGIGILPE